MGPNIQGKFVLSIFEQKGKKKMMCSFSEKVFHENVLQLMKIYVIFGFPLQNLYLRKFWSLKCKL